jgi:uncharacterized RDD family membrane protein YckC
MTSPVESRQTMAMLEYESSRRRTVHYERATLRQRFNALECDCVIIFLFNFVVWISLVCFSVPDRFIYISLASIIIIYGCLEPLAGGSFGKMALDLRIRNANGSTAAQSTLVMRTLLKFVAASILATPILLYHFGILASELHTEIWFTVDLSLLALVVLSEVPFYDAILGTVVMRRTMN